MKLKRNSKQQEGVLTVCVEDGVITNDEFTFIICYNKLCAWRHDMPPPLSSPCGLRSASRRRADRRACRRQRSSSFPRSIRSHADHCSCLCVNAAVSKPAWWPWPLTLKVVSRVTCDVGYLCANFGLTRPLCSWRRPDVRDRQTDIRQKHRLMPPP